MFQQKIGQLPKRNPHQALGQKLYTRLRLNLIKNVYEQWAESGFAWEQYSPEDGMGQRTQHFTGWTSLVVKIMGMPDLSGGSEGFDVSELNEVPEEKPKAKSGKGRKDEL